MQLVSALLRNNDRLQLAASNARSAILIEERPSSAIARVQFALTKLGHVLPGSTSKCGLDGIFGNETRRAVMDFQRKSRLKPDGIVGPHTLAKLDEILAKMPLGGVAAPYPVSLRGSVQPCTAVLLASAVTVPAGAATNPPSGSPHVRFSSFNNSGTGVFGRLLGPFDALTFRMNAVELHFAIDADVRKSHKNFKPIQWSGTESSWLKQGVPPFGDGVSSPWKLHKSGPGKGLDGPLLQNQKDLGSEIVYFDSPGPNVGTLVTLKPRVSRLYVVQNFTGWIVATQGGTEERMCPVAAWHSVTDLVCINWYVDEPAAVPQWQRYGSRSGQGWADTAKPPNS